MTYKFVQEDIRTSTGTEGTFLIPRKIHDVLIDEVDKALIPRSLAALYIGPNMIPGSSYDLNLVTPTSMNVRVTGEGAEVWLSDPAFEANNIKPIKYGLRVNITEEMLEDAKWNLLEKSIQIAAKRFAENETSLILTQLQGCTNNVAGGAAITIANITRGMQYLEDADYTATDALIGTEAVNDIRNIDTFVEADKLGSREMIQRGMIGIIYGMTMWRFSTNAAPTTTYSKYCYIIDRAHSYVIVEKRPVTVKQYIVETHDTQGVAITQRIAIERLRDTATCRISTS